MLSLRVSATDIDALRRYRADEEADLADLLAQLRHQSAPTEAMAAGSAFHSAIEIAEPGEHGQLAANGYVFDLNLAGTLDLPVIREMKVTRDYLIDGVLVTLVGKVDAAHGRRIDDHKFTSHFDAERFLGTMQWRVYLEVFGADEFRWNVFEGREVGEGSRQYVVSALHPLTMHRYPGMAEDVQRELTRFVEFAREHLPERIKAEAAQP